jgi:hypothetical protein
MESGMKNINLSLLAFTIVLVGGCGASGSVVDTSGLVDENLGQADFNTLVRLTPNALTTRFGYRILQFVEDSEDVRYETDWKLESTYPDEREEGYSSTRTRIFITARPRNRSSSIAATYTVKFEGQVERQALGLDVWEKLPLTKQRQEDFDRMIDYFLQAYRNALR